jgi:hypothetical protein
MSRILIYQFMYDCIFIAKLHKNMNQSVILTRIETEKSMRPYRMVRLDWQVCHGQADGRMAKITGSG